MAPPGLTRILRPAPERRMRFGAFVQSGVFLSEHFRSRYFIFRPLFTFFPLAFHFWHVSGWETQHDLPMLKKVLGLKMMTKLVLLTVFAIVDPFRRFNQAAVFSTLSFSSIANLVSSSFLSAISFWTMTSKKPRAAKARLTYHTTFRAST